MIINRREYATPNLHYPYGSFHRQPNHYPAHRNPSSTSRLSEMSLNPLILFSFLFGAIVKPLYRKLLRYFFHFPRPGRRTDPVLPVQTPAPRITNDTSLLENLLISSPASDSLSNPYPVNELEDCRDFPCQDAVFLPSPTETCASDSEQLDRVIISIPELTYPLSNPSPVHEVEDCRDFPCQDAVFLPSPKETCSSDSEQLDWFIISVPEVTYSLSITTAREEETEESSVVIQEIAPAEKVQPPAKSSQAEEVMIIKRTVAVDQGQWIMHYSSRHRILLVGEGDFSFSAALAVAFGRAARMIATSLDSIDFLMNNYKNAASNIMELKRRMCIVMHGINARKMADHKLLEDLTFDRIIFNFPFAGFFRNLPRDEVLRRHRELVSQFLKNAKDMLSENGEIHISHKTNGFHVEWNLECLASSFGLRLIEAVKFNHRDYPGYRTKYGFGGDKDFNCYPSKTYKFGYGC